jgi:hypothetical protein
MEVDIFPNPASGKLNVMISSPSGKVNIKLYNALGQIMRDFDTSDKSISLNLDDLKAGIYYVGADDGVRTLLKRFIRE